MRAFLGLTLAMLLFAGCESNNRPSPTSSTTGSGTSSTSMSGRTDTTTSDTRATDPSSVSPSTSTTGTRTTSPSTSGTSTTGTSTTGTTGSSTTSGTNTSSTTRPSTTNNDSSVSAFQQSNSQADIDLVSKIRAEVVKIDNISVSGRNVKIVTDNGKVVLDGSVDSPAERDAIVRVARDIAGPSNVTSNLEVMQR